MRRHIMKLVAGFLVASALSSGIARADTHELAKELRENILNFEHGVQSSSAPETNDAEWGFSQFLLRFQPEAGLTVGGIVKTKIVPEVELVWRRTQP